MANDLLKVVQVMKRVVDTEAPVKKFDFMVHIYLKRPASYSFFNLTCPEATLSLDEEDIKYLYNKYSTRLQEELDDKVKVLKEEYAALIDKK